MLNAKTVAEIKTEITTKIESSLGVKLGTNELEEWEEFLEEKVQELLTRFTQDTFERIQELKFKRRY